MEYASKGVAGSGLGLGIAGTALGLLNGGGGNILGGVLGGNYNRYEAEKDAQIARLETEVKLRDANFYAIGEVNNLRDYVEKKFDRVEHEICDQKVYNATNTATVGCLANQVNGLQAVLGSITKTVVPNGAICPGWGDVTVSITPTTTTASGT